MTSPVVNSQSTSDAPLATVAIGYSEAFAFVSSISLLLVTLFGHDWGVGANAQSLATVGVVLIPIFVSLARSLKHQAAMSANATVAVAQIQAAAGTVPTPASAAPAPAVQATKRPSRPRKAAAPAVPAPAPPTVTINKGPSTLLPPRPL